MPLDEAEAVDVADCDAGAEADEGLALASLLEQPAANNRIGTSARLAQRVQRCRDAEALAAWSE